MTMEENLQPRTLNVHELRQGFIGGLVLIPAIVAFGAVFGALAAGLGLTGSQAMLMSGFVYSNSAQLAAVGAWSDSAGPIALGLVVLLMNARYVLYGAALRPWLKNAPPIQVYTSLFLLGDGNWILSMKRFEKGQGDVGYVIGSGLSMYCAWMLGTSIGLIAGSGIGMTDPSVYGLDFLLVAFAAALATDTWKGRRSLPPAFGALIAALVTTEVAPDGWPILTAGMAGGSVAFVSNRRARNG